MRPHQPDEPPEVVVVVAPVVVVPAAGELVAVVVVVVVELEAEVDAADGLAAGLAWARAAAGITARLAAKRTPAAPVPMTSFIGTFSSEEQCLTCPYYPVRTLCRRPNARTLSGAQMIQTPIVLDNIRKDPARVMAQNGSASLLDLDDGVLCLEFHSKGNTLDGGTIEIAERAFEIIPGRYKGLVVGNQGANFSFGANLRWLLSVLDEIGTDREKFRRIAKRFQRITTGMRTVPFPTVSAPFALTIGGAVELSMYADRVHAHAEMRASLPEAAVGILPDLGGTSELYIRCIDAAGSGNEAAGLREAFQTIVFIRRSNNAEEARSLQFLKPHDRVSTDLSRLIDDAKTHVLELSENYEAPAHRRDIRVLGDAAYDALNQAIEMAVKSGTATAYDAEIARAVARVMTGGPGPARIVTHEELLDLETQYFQTLVFDERTRARMEYMLEHGTPLRN